MDYIGILGFAAGAISIVSFVPQAVRVWRTRSVKDLSALSYTLLIVGAVMWTSYGILRSDWPIIFPNVIILVLLSSIMVAKIRFK